MQVTDFSAQSKMQSFEQIQEDLKQKLSQKRYQHTLGVVKTAGELAQKYGADVGKARLAALLHDCSRHLSETQMRTLADKTAFADEYPEETLGEALLHAIASEVLARDVYGVDDMDVLRAVRWHTTGTRGLGDIAKIVYSADMIEPTRDYDGVNKLRVCTMLSLNEFTFMCCEHTVRYLKGRGQHIHGATVDFYNELKEKI